MLRNLSLIVLFFCSAFCYAENQVVFFNDPRLTYEGRIIFKSDATEFSWCGTNVTIQFEGTWVSAVLKDLDTANYYNVIVDNEYLSKFHTGTTKQTYLLASDLKEGKHQVQLFKRTEWDKGKTLFYSFELAEDAKVLSPAPPKKRKIEFYGNSITSGYAIEDNSGQDRGFGYFQNNYLTYASVTARHFNAEYSCISKSGIGLMVSWFPLLMPEMYDRTNPTDSTSKWNFSKYKPDIIVINLLQNDSWLVNKPDHEQFKYRFGTKAPDESYIVASYQNFVLSIREKYPQASIICALGSMDATREGSPWPGYIKKAITTLDDPKIYTHFFPFIKKDGHPNVAEQKTMAKSLIDFIDKNIKW
jgi:hypothetical protein